MSTGFQSLFLRALPVQFEKLHDKLYVWCPHPMTYTHTNRTENNILLEMLKLSVFIRMMTGSNARVILI